MKYRDFGNTGIKISALGFGAMRLPEFEKDGKWYIDEEKAIAAFHRAFELGVNYVDTAYFYCHGNSEYTVGKALKGYRDKVSLSTKIPLGHVKESSDYFRILEEQMKKLDVDCIDFYHFHGIGIGAYKDIIQKFDLLNMASKAKQQGLIKHISFSFHDVPSAMKELVDTGAFESVLCQYNLLDRSNEEAISYAKAKGLGTIVMGPVGGGRLAHPSELFINKLGESAKSTPELAMRFVTSNPDICCALSGMSTIEMVEQNAAIASIEEPLSKEELNKIEQMLAETKELANLYCTGCSYCMPCPMEIKIPDVFQKMINHKVYKLTESAKADFKNFGTNPWFGAHPSKCIECGQCLEKCPQKINIPERLKEVIAELS